MSGHSKWHSIKHKKASADAKRGKIFTRLIKEISVAARIGGGNLSDNPRLRVAVDKAKAANMPKDNIERAIKKGTGELPGVTYEEVTYEGYGPGGVAVLVESMTDNKNRTVSDMRYVFSKRGGELGKAGCVAWMFEKKGVIVVEGEGVEEDELMDVILEAGAEDMQSDDSTFEITTSLEDFESVKEAVEKAGYKISLAEINYVPQNDVKLEGKKAEQMLKLMEELEEHDDVQNVSANFDIPEEIIEKVGS